MVGGWGAYDMGFKKWWSMVRSCFRDVDEYDAERIWYVSTKEERERCARVCEQYLIDRSRSITESLVLRSLAEAIRKGGMI
jgi:hypothetical protein